MLKASTAAWLDSYRQDAKAALQSAAADGFRLLHANTTKGELSPTELTRTGRRHLAHDLRALGLSLDALCALYPDHGLADPRHADERVDHLRRTLELCADLRVGRATATVAGFSDERCARLADEVLAVVADLADRFRVHVALHPTAPEIDALAERVRRLNCPYVGLALDSAAGADLPQAAERYATILGCVHLRDVRRIGERFEEVSFGRGEVEFSRLLETLDRGDFAGPLVVRRDSAGDVDALRQGREYIQALLNSLGPR